jgi:hypothetical protein
VTTQWPPYRVDVIARGGVPQWRPWKALTQAEYNAIQSGGDWDPNTLYVVTPQRVMHGGSEVWPGTFDGGLVSATMAQNSVANPNIVIPTTSPGNLVAVIVHRWGGGATNPITGVTDSAGQTWKNAGWGYAAATTSGIHLWYLEGSAAIDSVTVTTAANALSMTVVEVAGIVPANALDVKVPDGASAGINPAVVLSPSQRSFMLAAVGLPNVAGLTVPERPDPPWHNLDDVGIPAQQPIRVAAGAVVEGGATGVASWTFGPSGTCYFVGAAFRAITADVP